MNLSNLYNMAQKGVSTRSEALEFDHFLRLIDSLHADGEYRWELFCILSCTLALRVSDVLNRRWEDLLHHDHCTVKEIKTGKTRQIPIEPSTHARLIEIYSLMGSPAKDGLVFLSKKTGKAITPQYVNETLKRLKRQYNLPIKNFSSHSFRKTFGRRVYNAHGRSEHSIVLINRAFQHRSISTTLIYLGLFQDELNEVYKKVAL